MRYGVRDLRSKKFSLLGCTVGLRTASGSLGCGIGFRAWGFSLGRPSSKSGSVWNELHSDPRNQKNTNIFVAFSLGPKV